MDVYPVRLTAAHAITARKVGAGNLSDGVRLALEVLRNGNVHAPDSCYNVQNLTRSSDMHIPENSSDEELILLVDNNPNATPLERKLADRLAERKRELETLHGRRSKQY